MKKKPIDFFRFIAALMIVAIHIFPFANINMDVDYTFTRVLFRIAVPFFLMITGFFILPKSLLDKSKLEQYTLKIIKIYIISMIIYFPVNVYNGYLRDIDVLAFLKDIFINGFFYHLWYFPALILGLWITYFIIKKIKNPVIFFLILYMIGLFGDSYYGFIDNLPILKEFYTLLFTIFDYTRNGLFYTPIFLYIGYSFSQTKRRESDENNFYYFLVFSISMAAEGLLLYKYAIPRHTSMYLFLLPTSYFLGRLFLTTECKTNKKLRNLSTWLYILHPLFLILVRLVAKVFHIENILVSNNLVTYICVVFSTVIFICIIEKMKEVMHCGR